MTMLPATPETDQAELRAWRRRHGLSMRELGELLGVTRLAVQRWEAGTHNIPPFLYLALRELERQLGE
jgi:transcriptional regulator with XRE-family HTH domain